MFCAGCGKKNSADSRFCKYCGHHLTPAAATQPDAKSADERVKTLLERASRAVTEGDTEQGVMLCREALRLQPDILEAHQLLTQLYETLGERDQAIHAQERVVELDPDNVAARTRLASLRNEARYASSRPPHIVYAGQNSGANGVQIVTMCVAGAALLVLGGVVALLWQRPDRDAGMKKLNGISQELTAGPTHQAPNPGSVASVGSGAQPSMQEANPYQGLLSLPATTIIQYPLPSQRIPQGYVAPIPNPETSRPSRPSKSAGSGRGKMLLPGDDDGEITIQVGKPSGNTEQVSANPAPGSAESSAADSGSSTSQSFMAMGDREFVSGAFDKAISAYRQALPEAGDNSGYLYQRIGDSYQKRGDKESAKTNYTNAISAYQKLIDAGREVEVATDGVRACERSIKTCNF